MPSYRFAMSQEDRWRIVQYLRTGLLEESRESGGRRRDRGRIRRRDGGGMSVNGGTGALGAKGFFGVIGVLAGLAAVSFVLLWIDGADGDFPWAFALVMWMFVLGLSQAGICFTAVMRLCKAEFRARLLPAWAR